VDRYQVLVTRGDWSGDLQRLIRAYTLKGAIGVIPLVLMIGQQEIGDHSV
jgi:hypothetical protein